MPGLLSTMRRLLTGSRARAHASGPASPQLSLFDVLAAPQTESAPGLGAIASSSSPGFAELCRNGYAHVRVEVGMRLRESWRVRWMRRHEALHIQIPQRLQEAPREIKLALLEWAVLVTRRGLRRNPEARRERARLEHLVRAFLASPETGAIDGISSAARRRLAQNHRRLQRLNPKGVHHDLDQVFVQINRTYFDAGLEARLTWSARKGGLSTHSLAQDGEGKTYHLISISRGYDNPEVTPEILGGVVYHECLHIAIPPRMENGKRIVHGADFRRREKEYAHYEVWRRWHREGLPRAVRKLRTKS